MLSSYFDKHSIRVAAQELSFSEAVAEATGLLVSAGQAKPEYIGEVLANLEALGPYFVVAPGVAIAHAPPSVATIKPGMALLKLATPCESGSANDPVTLVFALCSPDSESHLDLLAAFAEKLSDSQVMNSLLNASAESVISAILFENQL